MPRRCEAVEHLGTIEKILARNSYDTRGLSSDRIMRSYEPKRVERESVKQY